MNIKCPGTLARAILTLQFIYVIQGNERIELTKNEILARVNAYDIYRYYLGFDFIINKMYLSPFRKDNNASFGIFSSKGGLYFNDFGCSSKGDSIEFVQTLFNINFNEALIKIDNDLKLGIRSGKVTLHIKSPIVIEDKRPVIIQIIPRKFNSEELKYWNQYAIDLQDLKNNDIYAIQNLYINKRIIGSSDLRFAYLFKDADGEYLKIYSPYSKDFKWVSNVPVKKALNIDKLPRQSNIITIAKSKKDKIVLNKLLSDVYEAQKEGTEVISNELDNFFNENYDRKICFFDNDESGKKANLSLNPKGYDWINIPNSYYLEGIKDPSDFVKSYGYDKLKELLMTKNII